MPATAQRFQTGTGSSAVSFAGIPFPIAMHSSIPPKVATGYDIARDSRMDLFPLRHDDWSGGFLATSGIYGLRERNRVFFNQGLVAPRPGMLHLPFVSTAQTALDNIDISGFRAANKRVHGVMSSVGLSGSHLVLGIGTKAYRTVDFTDPSLELLDDGLTDNILSIAILKLNSTDYCAVSTDGTTNDTMGTATTAGPNAFSAGQALVTHANAADGFYAMDYFATLGGGGWNVFYGILNQVNGWWAMPSTATIPITSSTMLPVVYKDGADIVNANAIEFSLTNLDPTAAANEGQGAHTGAQDATEITSGIWINTGNIFSSNDADASYDATPGTNNAIAGLTSRLHAGGFATTTIPRSARLTELIATIEHAEDDADLNVYLAEVNLIVNGQTAGSPRSAGDELGTTDSTDTVGGTGDDWGTGGQLTGEQLHGIGLALQYSVAQTDASVVAAGAGITVDHVRITSLKYVLPGTQASLPKGGNSPGKAPHEKDLLCIRHPVSDEETTIFKPNILTKCKFEFDPEGERILVSYTQPPTQMPNVVDHDWYQGGIAICGGKPGDLAEQVKLIDNNNVTRDLGFPAVHGTIPVRMTGLFARGAFLMGWVSNAASTDCQLWYYFDGKWAAYGALFSITLGGAMSTQPLNWAEKTLNTHQNYIYCIYPTSTNTSALRQFVPTDLVNADPFLVNTSIVKEGNGTTGLYIQGVELESLPAEANNSILSLYMHSRQVDNNTSYGFVKVDIVTDGDKTFASPEITQTFDAAAEVFTERNIVSSGDPGIAFRTTITRVTLGHEDDSTETPNGCTVQINMTSDWDPKREFGVLLIDRRAKDASNWFVAPQTYPNPYALCDKIDAQIESKVSQAFLDVGTGTLFKRPVKHKPYRLAWRQDMSPGTWEAVEFMALNFLETAGGLS